jgi:glyoxylate/hydroxypyruvate reductase A
MALLFISPTEDADEWRRHFARLLPGEDFRVWPDGVGERRDIEFLLVWRPARGSMKGFPNARAILNLGAGVDYVLADPDLPDLPLVSLKDEGLAQGMSEYVVHAVLHLHRDFHRFRDFQREHEWRGLPQADTTRRRVGILGFGHLGQAVAKHLLAFGFPLAGWSRTRKTVAGVASFVGPDGLKPFLARTDILVCLAPSTAETKGIVNSETLAALPKGSYVINAARGGLVVEDDLLAALDSGHVAGAFLDVFATEPLPAGHPFWRHPKVIATPHVAALTLPGPGAEETAANIKRIRRGEPPHGLVDKRRGY